MTIREAGGRSIEIYDSIEEMPVVRFHKYNKMLLIEAGVGSGVSALERHIARARAYLRGNDADKASLELSNMEQALRLTATDTDLCGLAFAALVRSIDGKPCDDISDEGLRRTAEMLGMMTVGERRAMMDEAKKKADAELTVYFPAMFEDPRRKEYYDTLRERTLVKADILRRGGSACDDELKRLERINDSLLTFYAPKPFSGAGSAEVGYDKDFHGMCLMLSEKYGTDAREMSVLAFYTAVERMNAEAKRLMASTRRKKG